MTRLRGSDAKRDALLAAQVAADLVSVRRRPTYAWDLDGFVAGIGTKWVLLATTRDGGHLDGWIAVRIADVDRVRPKSDSFERTVATREAWWPPAPPFPLDLDRTIDLLRGVPADDLVGIEKEHERSALWVGRVTELEPGTVWLQEADPQGRWTREASYRLGAVTSVQLRTEYLTALASVLPEPPQR